MNFRRRELKLSSPVYNWRHIKVLIFYLFLRYGVKYNIVVVGRLTLSENSGGRGLLIHHLWRKQYDTVMKLKLALYRSCLKSFSNIFTSSSKASFFVVDTRLHLLDRMQTNFQNTCNCFWEQIRVFVWYLSTVLSEI